MTRNSSGAYEYEYVLKDHLGNTRVTFKDANNDGIVGASDICQTNNYYPFGLNMEGNWNSVGCNGEGNKYGYNQKEWNDDFGLGWNDYGARMYDPAIGRWHALDPMAEKFTNFNPYAYVLNNPVSLVDNDGREPEPPGRLISVFYHGGPTGGGKTVTDHSNAGYTGTIFNDTYKEADSKGIEMYGTIIAPGLTAGSAVENGLNFLKNADIKAGDKVMIYGYSYGGDVAVELAAAAKEAGISVDLLVTVDASDGPLQQTTVDNTIPDNVKENQNYYQTENSGNSSTARIANATLSTNSRSDSNSSNSPGSHGGINKAQSPSKTNVFNHNKTAPGVNHGNIQQKAREDIRKNVQSLLNQ